MKNYIVLFSMLFFHIADDYYLQGWLASAKQREWWRKNSPEELYKNDYIVALLEHAFSWTFCVHVPVIVSIALRCISCPDVVFIVSFIANWVLHAIVDNEKANKHRINLIQDQTIHVLQVICIWFAFFS